MIRQIAFLIFFVIIHILAVICELIFLSIDNKMDFNLLGLMCISFLALGLSYALLGYSTILKAEPFRWDWERWKLSIPMKASAQVQDWLINSGTYISQKARALTMGQILYGLAWMVKITVLLIVLSPVLLLNIASIR